MAAPQYFTSEPKIPPRRPRYFKLEQANRTLPLVRRIVRDIVNTHRQATELQAKLDAQPSVQEAMLVQADLEVAVDRLQEYVEELGDVGCELKDYEMGLIDFPGRHEGRNVLLCWRLGEEKVEHWHELHSGYASRQSTEVLKED